MSDSRTGSCLCGAVRFETRGPLRPVVFCHCHQCRRQTGNFVAATELADEDIGISGTENLTWYAASGFARRGFCAKCGSFLFWKRNGANRLAVAAGAFDEPSGLVAQSHIYCADKGEYYEIADGLPQYAKGGGGVIVSES